VNPPSVIIIIVIIIINLYVYSTLLFRASKVQRRFVSAASQLKVSAMSVDGAEFRHQRRLGAFCESSLD
jgi:hypothetical protein